MLTRHATLYSLPRARKKCVLRCRYFLDRKTRRRTWPRLRQNKAWSPSRQQEKITECQRTILTSGVLSFRLSLWRCALLCFIQPGLHLAHAFFISITRLPLRISLPE